MNCWWNVIVGTCSGSHPVPCEGSFSPYCSESQLCPSGEAKQSSHVSAAPDLALLQWLKPEIVDTAVFLLCLFLVLDFIFDSPMPLFPEVWSSDLFCAQALPCESPSLDFLSLYWFLYPETWESGSCQLVRCHFGLFSGPLNYFPFLISQSFEGQSRISN